LLSTQSNAATEDGRWHAGIGDASIFGWLTVLVYLLAVVRCIFKALSSKQHGGNYHFWIYLGLFLLLLGINKQLDLQSWLTESLRDSAKMHGWYGNREAVQIGFITLLGFGMVVAIISMRLYLASSWRNYKITWIGITLLLTFILMRAASFHHMDIFIRNRLLGLSVNAILEIGALLLIIIGTFFNRKNINPLTAITVSIRDYVEITKDGNPVQCPQCGLEPLSKPKDGRVFKCRSCGHRYSVRLVNR
jgi:DNA-directed RNA polymerase subunit RPC12/RpoP